MSRQRRWVVITLVVLIGAVLRLWNLGQAPPGLSHDEVINGLVAREILRGHHALYFTEAKLPDTNAVGTGGHEPLYSYVQAATVGLFGENWLGLRWPSFAFGLLTLAAVYALVRRLFDFSTALIAMAWLGVSFWPLFYARVGLRAVALPFTAALFAYFLVRSLGLPADQPARQSPDWLYAGIFLGLSVYTYMAARILPFIWIVFLVYLLVIRQPGPFPWSRVLRLMFVAALLAAPLVLWLVTHPGAEERVLEVREPLDRLLKGDPSLIWRNLVSNLGFFTFVGDPWFHQGLPGRPVFPDLISAISFWIGVCISVWRWRTPRYGFLLIWLIGALVPSVLSSHAPPGLISDAPSSIRDILAIVVAFVFPAVAVTEAGRWIEQRSSLRRPLRRVSILVPVVILVLLPALIGTVRDYFARWSRMENVRYLYQEDLTAVARQLDALGDRPSVVVAGLSVRAMDRPTLAFAARASVEDVRLCDPRQALLVPNVRPGTVFVPEVVPFDEEGHLEQRLRAWSEVVTQNDFTTYTILDSGVLNEHLQRLGREVRLPDGSSVSLPVSFDGHLALLGYERLGDGSTPQRELSLLTYWRVQSPPTVAVKAFVHLLDEDGHLVSQHDALGSPPQGWAEGDLVVQKHTMPLPDEALSGVYVVQTGLYHDTAEGERLPVLTADRVLLYSLEVSE